MESCEWEQWQRWLSELFIFTWDYTKVPHTCRVTDVRTIKLLNPEAFDYFILGYYPSSASSLSLGADVFFFTDSCLWRCLKAPHVKSTMVCLHCPSLPSGSSCFNAVSSKFLRNSVLLQPTVWKTPCGIGEPLAQGPKERDLVNFRSAAENIETNLWLTLSWIMILVLCHPPEPLFKSVLQSCSPMGLLAWYQLPLVTKYGT